MRRSRPGPPTWWAALAGLALPVACPGCGAPDVALCAGCRAALVVRPYDVTTTSGPPGVPVSAGVPYEGIVRRLVLQWKDGGRADLTPALADVLAAVIERRLRELVAELGKSGGRPGVATPSAGGEAGPLRRAPVVWLVPAPSSSAARRRRGEDLIAALARHAAGRVSGAEGAGILPVGVAAVLRQRRGVADQAGLGVAQRRSNLHGGVVLTPGRRPPPVALVVDDVVTSGATAAAAVSALRAGGTSVLGVCAVSATPSRRPLLVRRRLG